MSLTWGRFAALEAALPDGESIPRPDVADDLQWAWRAWHRLHEDRPWNAGGMGAPTPRGIRFIDIVNWCAFHDLPGEHVGFLDTCCRAMDSVYFEHYAGQMRQ